MIYKQYYMIGANNKTAVKRLFGRFGQRQLPAAFTLMEVMVAVAIFSVIILSSTSIFQMVIQSQRSALATQNVQESLKYFMEVIGKEIRMAQRNMGVCPGLGHDNVFIIHQDSQGQQGLRFKNYDGKCVAYSLVQDEASGDVGRFQITRDGETGFISPAKISLTNLHFVIQGDVYERPLVTISLTAHAAGDTRFKSEMTLQTSVTSRFYK